MIKTIYGTVDDHQVFIKHLQLFPESNLQPILFYRTKSLAVTPVNSWIFSTVKGASEIFKGWHFFQLFVTAKAYQC